jgi:type II secretory pathway pseudopilin PulG
MAKRLLIGLGVRLRRDEQGFTLIELMVAAGIVLVTLMTIVSSATVGFGDIALAQQRQAANGLASRIMEEVRAIPYDTVKKGLSDTDLSSGSDPNITSSGGAPTTVYSYGGEEIPHGTNANVTPIVPHKATVTIGQTTFTRSVYVTYYLNNKSSHIYRVTVLVTWTRPGSLGTPSVKIQSLIYTPAGCLSTATHPFAAPCQAFLYGSTSIGTGSITITGTIAGISFDHATLITPKSASDMQVEQISSVLGSTNSSAVSLMLTGQAAQFAGVQSASSGADDDPATSGTNYNKNTLPAQSSGSLSASGSGNTISVSTGGGDTGATTSTTVATAGNVCADKNNVAQTDSLPCGNSNAKQAGTLSSGLTLTAGTKNLGAATLASILAAPSSSVAYTNRDVPSLDGLVHGDATRSLGTVTLGGLPPNLTVTPVGWAGYLVRVTSFTDSVSSESGLSTAAPSVSASGTISYWNGTGYTSMTIAPGSSAAVPAAAVHVLDPAFAPGLTVIDVSASLSTGGTTKSDPAGCGASCTRTSASATSNSPLKGTITYQVTYNGVVIANLTISIDLGPLSTKTSYTQAPSRT